MPLYETTHSEILNLLNTLFEKQGSLYEKIYISFGSKYNDPVVHYDFDKIPPRNTNAPFQMIPAFLRDYSETDHILCICIDDFSNPSLLETNRQIISPVIKGSMDMIFVDWNIVGHDLFKFLPLYLNLLKKYAIRPEKMICALYFHFLNPNPTEEIFSEKAADISRSIFKTSIYRNSLYLWYGYMPNLYNCISPAYYSLVYYSENLSILHKQFEYSVLNSYDIGRWIPTLDPRIKLRMRTFLTNCYDITQFSNDGNLYPLFQFSDIGTEE